MFHHADFYFWIELALIGHQVRPRRHGLATGWWDAGGRVELVELQTRLRGGVPLRWQLLLPAPALYSHLIVNVLKQRTDPLLILFFGFMKLLRV